MKNIYIFIIIAAVIYFFNRRSLGYCHCIDSAIESKPDKVRYADRKPKGYRNKPLGA